MSVCKITEAGKKQVGIGEYKLKADQLEIVCNHDHSISIVFSKKGAPVSIFGPLVLHPGDNFTLKGLKAKLEVKIK